MLYTTLVLWLTFCYKQQENYNLASMTATIEQQFYTIDKKLNDEEKQLDIMAAFAAAFDTATAWFFFPGPLLSVWVFSL